MPDWLPSVLVQFPIVVVIGLVAHYAYNQLKENHAAQQLRDDAIHERLVKLAEESAAAIVKAREAEVEFLREAMKVELAKLGKLMSALTKRPLP